jgi:biotin transport system substrate-specific component
MSNRLSARDFALIAIFAGITAALGFIPPIPVGPVPITAQTLGVILAGAIIGWKRAGLSMILVFALIAIGLPILSGGRGGLGQFVSVTSGFLIAWLPVAALIGWFAEKVGAPYSLWKGIVINVIFGIFLMYLLGIGGMMLFGKLGFVQALVANAFFLPGDAVKCVLAALIAKGVHSAYPGLLPARASTTP